MSIYLFIFEVLYEKVTPEDLSLGLLLLKKTSTSTGFEPGNIVGLETNSLSETTEAKVPLKEMRKCFAPETGDYNQVILLMK